MNQKVFDMTETLTTDSATARAGSLSLYHTHTQTYTEIRISMYDLAVGLPLYLL